MGTDLDLLIPVGVELDATLLLKDTGIALLLIVRQP